MEQVNRGDVKPGEHCWHPTGAVILTEPRQECQRCCWCGANRTKRFKPQPGHGVHVPLTDVGCQEAYYVYDDDKGEKPCAGNP